MIEGVRVPGKESTVPKSTVNPLLQQLFIFVAFVFIEICAAIYFLILQNWKMQMQCIECLHRHFYVIYLSKFLFHAKLITHEQ